MALNPAQAAAVTHPAGPLLVFAGAGSGKTRVIVHRIARLIEEGGLPAHRILAVTFTNRAAREMAERCERLLPGTAGRVWFGTFHAICARLIRTFAADLGMRRDFVIYDDADQRAAVQRAMRELDVSEKRLRPRTLASAISRMKQAGTPPEAMHPKSPFEQVLQRVYERYERALRSASAFDFADLVGYLPARFDADDSLRQQVASRFDALLVDEFQDTNTVQYRFIQHLSRDHRCLCVVGDDDQSIYRWRGADRHNIRLFRQDFPDAEVVLLEQNYRSTQAILNVANAIIAHSTDREPKRLWTDNPEGAQVRLWCCHDGQDEAAAFLRVIEEARLAGRKLSDIALFYRTNAQSRPFEEMLRSARLPYRVVGGMRFYERAEIKDALAYLRLVLNPDDDVALLRVVNTPPRGVGKATLGALITETAERGGSLWDTLQRDAALPRRAAKALVGFRELIADLRTRYASVLSQDPGYQRQGQQGRGEAADDVSVTQLVGDVLEGSGLQRMYQDEDSVVGDARMENVKELLNSVMEWERGKHAEAPTLSAFLERVALENEDRGEGEASDALTMMSVHAAKELEFPQVFVAGLEEGLFPLQRPGEEGDMEQLEEERRLAYVAVTRAQERLDLAFATSRRIYGQLKVAEPSRFLDEIRHLGLQTLRSDGSPLGSSILGGSMVGSSMRGGPMSGGPVRPPSGSTRSASGPTRDAFGGHDVPSDAFDGVDFPPPAPLPSQVQRHDSDSYIDYAEGGDPDALWQPGLRVRHRRFGEGEILALVPGLPPRARIAFGSEVRQVLIAYLQPEGA